MVPYIVGMGVIQPSLYPPTALGMIMTMIPAVWSGMQFDAQSGSSIIPKDPKSLQLYVLVNLLALFLGLGSLASSFSTGVNTI